MQSQPNSAEQLYQTGIADFERGNYQAAVKQLEQARTLVPAQTSRGGEIQIWLANAYDAIGNSEQALALCRSLAKHPDQEVRKSACYVLGIISAPKLKKPEDAISAIPNLKNLDPSNNQIGGARSKPSKASDRQDFQEETLSSPLTDPTSNNQFLWIAMAIALISLLSFWLL